MFAFTCCREWCRTVVNIVPGEEAKLPPGWFLVSDAGGALACFCSVDCLTAYDTREDFWTKKREARDLAVRRRKAGPVEAPSMARLIELPETDPAVSIESPIPF